MTGVVHPIPTSLHLPSSPRPGVVTVFFSIDFRFKADQESAHLDNCFLRFTQPLPSLNQQKWFAFRSWLSSLVSYHPNQHTLPHTPFYPPPPALLCTQTNLPQSPPPPSPSQPPTPPAPARSATGRASNSPPAAACRTPTARRAAVPTTARTSASAPALAPSSRTTSRDAASWTLMPPRPLLRHRSKPRRRASRLKLES